MIRGVAADNSGKIGAKTATTEPENQSLKKK